MSRVRVIGGVGDLANDMRGIVMRAPVDMRRTVAANAREGNKLARSFARESAGAHGKHYHKAFTVEAHGLSAEYGPDASRPQGGMSFERGSRNQPPHLDLARSADIIGPKFAKDVGDLPDGWFW